MLCEPPFQKLMVRGTRARHTLDLGTCRVEFALDGFVHFILNRDSEGAMPPNQTNPRWATRIEGRRTVTVGNEFGVACQSCPLRRRSDPPVFVPKHAAAPVMESPFEPYVKRPSVQLMW